MAAQHAPTWPMAGDFHLICGYIERARDGFVERCMVCGVAFGGTFIVMNTRFLHALVGRSKSSINSAVQEMGYVALRNRGKSRAFISTILPDVAADIAQMRQWGVRYAVDPDICFLSRIQPSPLLPTIEAQDLVGDLRAQPESDALSPRFTEPECGLVHVVRTPLGTVWKPGPSELAVQTSLTIPSKPVPPELVATPLYMSAKPAPPEPHTLVQVPAEWSPGLCMLPSDDEDFGWP
jgi:hypothetical protein